VIRSPPAYPAIAFRVPLQRIYPIRTRCTQLTYPYDEGRPTARHHNPPTLGAFYLGHLGPPSQLTYPDAFQYKRASKEEKRGERGEREEEGKNKIK
jgi:hypothetical protein